VTGDGDPPGDRSDHGHAHDPAAVADTDVSGGTSVAEPREDAAAEASDGPAKRLRAVAAGDSLGGDRYTLVEEIGEGGMATVYRARDRDLRRDVAVKVLFPHLARRDNGEVVRRFHREARAAAALEHANILRIYDVGGGDAGDPPFIVMELIRGRTLLAEVEQRGPILAEVVACIGALLCDALAAAHAAGIIHRDLKPANVLVAPGGRLLLADFGVARLETEDSLVTRTGALLGTPAYMSPEQASGDIATVKSDLYSLGATLYQLATGSLPYAGSPAKVMSQIAAGQLVPPVRRRPAVGPDLSRVIEALMASDPGERPSRAAAVATQLRALVIAGGLGDPAEELAAYFDDAERFVTGRIPTVVAALVASGKQAIVESKLTRAMALADRASELAPDDPAVKTLVETVTEGGRASKRRRAFALVGGGLALAGAATAAVLATSSGSRDEPRDAAMVATPVLADAGHQVSQLADAAVLASATPDAEVVANIPIDATTPANDARRVVRADARVPIDAAASDAPMDAPAPIDAAAPADAPARRRAEDMAKVIIKSTLWCEVSVDDKPRGRNTRFGILVDPGHHTIGCAQPGLKAWSTEVDLVAGEKRELIATVGGTFDVAIEITRGSELMIGPNHYPPHAHAKLAPGRYEVTVPGIDKKFLSITQSCTLRDAPELDCY